MIVRRTCSAFVALAVPLLCAAAAAEERVSLDIRDLDVADAVRVLATQADRNVVVDASVPHRNVTMRLRAVTFDEALETLARASDLETVRVGSIIYVGTPDAFNRRFANGARAGIRTERFALQNAAVDEVAHALADGVPKGTVVVADPRTQSLLVTGTADALARVREFVTALDAGEGLPARSVAMRYVKASDALAALKALMAIEAPATAYADDVQNAVVLHGSLAFVRRATALLATVDAPGRQVRYDVKVTDVTPQSDTSNVGLLFGGADVLGQQHAGSGSTVTTFANTTLAVNATLNALVTQGRASILARPSLSTLNNVQASLLVGQSYPIVYFDPRTGTQQVQFVNVGVNLTVTPTIGADGDIRTELSTDYSQFLSFVGAFPVIGTRKVQSTLRVRDGETIVIAGLFSDVDNATITKIPFLGDLPVLGGLFKNRQTQHTKDEIVFLITPHVTGTVQAAPAPVERE